MYRVKFERLTGVMERISGIFWCRDFLGTISGRLATGNWSEIYLVIFGILRQNFINIDKISISNHWKTLPHLTSHTGINIFYWPNSASSRIWTRVALSPHTHTHTLFTCIHIYIHMWGLCLCYVGITLVALVLRWLRWYFVGSVGIWLYILVILYFTPHVS